MLQINADLHIHSKYSMATSERMDLPTIASESRKKGIHLVATGDCLHNKWLSEIKKLKEENGILKFDGSDTCFIPTVEIEDANQVHHLLIVPEVSKAEEIREKLLKRSADLDTDGRPKVSLYGYELAEVAKDAGALIGPAHAFTPWTAMYAYHDSLGSCYRDMKDYIYFIELGLSADTSYADRIAELQCLTFLSNSDAHSPNTNKLAREFNRFEVADISFDELKKAIIRQEGRRPVLNVGMFPQEGKYNESACIRCFKHYTIGQSAASGWKCECGGRIKKGVKDRVNELADFDAPGNPPHRPPYMHLVPLSEIIAMAVGQGINTKKVKDTYETLISTFGNEVRVLIDASISEMNMVDETVVKAIESFREGRLVVVPGGGGQYGRVELRDGKTEAKPPVMRTKKNQKSLMDF